MAIGEVKIILALYPNLNLETISRVIQGSLGSIARGVRLLSTAVILTKLVDEAIKFGIQ